MSPATFVPMLAVLAHHPACFPAVESPRRSSRPDWPHRTWKSLLAAWRESKHGPRDGEELLASQGTVLKNILFGEESNEENKEEKEEGLIFSSGDVSQAARWVCVLIAGGGGTCLRPLFSQNILPVLIAELQTNQLLTCSQLEQVCKCNFIAHKFISYI